MNFYVTWQTSSKISLQERIGPFHIRAMAESMVDFVLTDPRFKVSDIDIETVQGE